MLDPLVGMSSAASESVFNIYGWSWFRAVGDHPPGEPEREERGDGAQRSRNRMSPAIHRDTKMDGPHFLGAVPGKLKTRGQLEEERKRRYPFDLHCLQFVGVEAQSLKDSGRDLLVENVSFHMPGREVRHGEQQRHMSIVLIEAAVFGDL